MDKIAVVILSWNGEKMLRQFLPGVLKHSTGSGVSVYVADNGSTDNSVALLQTSFPTIRLIRMEQNHGFAEGYNIALQEVDAEYVVLLNSDVEVTKGWLSPLTDYMDAHPEVAACQPKILSWRHKESFEYAGASGGFIDKYGYPFCRGRIMGVTEKDNGQYDSVAPVFWATGAALFIRLGEYREAGGFDGRFFAHMEEIDLCWRLRARGRAIVCIPQSTVYHMGAGTLKKENPYKTFLNFRNNLVMLHKNLSNEEYIQIMRIRFWLDYLAAFSFALKGQFPNASAVIRARKEFGKIKEEFANQRKTNIEKTVVKSIRERVNYSILAKFYMKRKRLFSELTLNNK